MYFTFFDQLSVSLPQESGLLGRFFQNEFGASAMSSELADTHLEVRFDEHLIPGRLKAQAAVGGMVFLKDDRLYISDGANRLAEWPVYQLGAPKHDIRVHPGFKPSRFYYYVMLPLLKYTLNLHQRTLFHASAVEVDGIASVFAAWGGTGKTNTLLGVLEEGGACLADDLAVVDSEGFVYPLPRQINLFAYNLRAHPRLRRLLPLRKKAQFIVVQSVATLGRAIGREHVQYIDALEKRFTNFVVSPDAIGKSAAKRSRAESVTFLCRAQQMSSQLDAPQVGEAVEMAAANLEYELKTLQELLLMGAFLSRQSPIRVVNEVDRAVLNSFLHKVAITWKPVVASEDRVEA